jgi:hypothetical protein
MKTAILSILLALFLVNACAQENKQKGEKKVKVPELVKKAFATKYPKATKIEWGLEKEGEYEVEFKMGKSEMSVVLDEKGDVLEVESEIKESELPQAIKTTLAKDFIGFKLDEIEKAEAKGVTSYEMEAKKDKAELELVFDAAGKLLKKEEKKKE